MINKYKKLQNGSDIRGIALDGVEGELPNLTPVEAECIGQSFALWLGKKLNRDTDQLKMAIGRDPRISGPDLLEGLAKGFGRCHAAVFDFGLASTPAMFMATVFPQFRCDGTVMITASHLPFNRNGFKFFTAEGGLDKQDIQEILEIAAQIDGQAEGTEGQVSSDALGYEPPESADIMTVYSAHLRQLIVAGAVKGDRPLEGMKIVVDAGNGSGGFYASEVLAPLGADVSGSQFLDPDGTFPNHAPNPENREAMESVSRRVLAAKADMGLIFDTDVDRSSAVDSKGREIARNGIIAMAAALIAGEHPGTTVVTDSITSRQLTDYLEKALGLKHFRYRRGYRNVINKSKELNEQGIDSQLAIETSGHAAFKENYFLDDGAYLAAKIVIKAAQLHGEGLPIDSVTADLQEPAEEEEIRIPIRCEDFGPYGDKILAELKAFVLENRDENGPAGMALSLEEPNYEGVRINFPGGWCLLRKSLHDPILPLNIAADETGGTDAIKKLLKDFLHAYGELDLSQMSVEDKHFVTCDQMKLLERRADEEGLSYYQMMENAGTGAFEAIRAAVPGGSALVFCGKGNNGGDGYVVARKMKESGYDVKIVMVSGEPKTEDAITNYRRLRDSVELIDMDEDPLAFTNLEGAQDLIVDAIYGTGFHGELSGNGLKAALFIRKAREDGVKVFSLDIPSGMGGDLMDPDGLDINAVKADCTITFHARKPVHMQNFAGEYCGEILVADIGIDEQNLMKA